MCLDLLYCSYELFNYQVLGQGNEEVHRKLEQGIQAINSTKRKFRT